MAITERTSDGDWFPQNPHCRQHTVYGEDYKLNVTHENPDRQTSSLVLELFPSSSQNLPAK